MAWWGRMFRWVGGSPDRTEETPASAVVGLHSQAGVWMDEQAALAMAPVYRAVTLISQSIAAMPLRIMEPMPDGSRRVANPEEMAVLWSRPNPEETRVEFIGRLLAHLLIWGDAFVFVAEPGPLGEARRLALIEPPRVDVGRDARGERLYVVDGRSWLEWRDWVRGSPRPGFVHLRIGSLDGLRGRGPVMAVLESLGVGRAAELYAARYFASAGVPGGIIYVSGRLSPEDARRLAEQFAAAHSGPNVHRVAVLDQGAKFESPGADPASLQLLDVRRFTVTEVARVFGIPPHLLGDASQSTSWGSGLEEQNRAFITLTLRPYIALLESALTDAFCAGTDYLIRIDPSALLQGNLQSRFAAYNAARQAGLMTINEIRDLEDLPGIGEAGDNVLTPLNMQVTQVPPRAGAEYIPEQ
ncbi:phage portal protein [Tepidiforma bonchosmolovskayae]|uniref:Phage portal protein n=1 Tax=Tepidiforma bonchosmolovskayae TaxID=2601677 RepID=A0ABX6BZC8_9CHLR|nr:phage portal protein [Tepidiforma bonchosmolovskayae]QFG02156.1 phage portal protein [Tepidiforma bonchosmolovskayae]